MASMSRRVVTGALAAGLIVCACGGAGAAMDATQVAPSPVTPSSAVLPSDRPTATPVPAATAPAEGVGRGGEEQPVVLTLATNDGPGSSQSVDDLIHFSEEVKRLSGGQITVELHYGAVGPDIDAYDQAVATLVAGGGADLGDVPARAVDELGVMSLRALQAPFLLTDDDAVDAVATSDIATDLMSGLPAIGLEGLALWPDGLRHPFSWDRPLLTLADFRAVKFRSPLSRTSWDTLNALGATPVDIMGEDAPPVGSGGLETSMKSAFNFPESPPGYLTANLTFFPKVHTLVANSGMLERLSAEQQRLLREAAATTTSWVVEHREREEDAGPWLCASGSSIVLARDKDVAAIVAATAPVYAGLVSDPLTKRLIDDLRGVMSALADPPFVAAPCTSEGNAVPTLPAGGDPSVLDGVYRADISVDWLIQHGANPQEASWNGGIFTLTFDDGVFNHHLDRDDSDCGGTYSVDGPHVYVAVRDECGTFDPLFAASWELKDGALSFTDIEPSNVFTRALWGSKPFVRIGDAR